LHRRLAGTGLSRFTGRVFSAIARPFLFDDLTLEIGISLPYNDNSTDMPLPSYCAEQEELGRALERGELSLVFQPIVDLSNHRTVAVEALLRWTHPHLGPRMPSSFIPVAEQSGLIVPLGAWVIREACRVATTLPPTIAIAVNLSPIQLRENDLVDTVISALRANDIAPGRIEFEITETTALESEGPMFANLAKLRDLGCSISLDDFGVGFASLTAIRCFPFDKLKIDRSFITNLGVDERSEAILSAILHLGRQMGVAVLAEGIETAEQEALVRLYGCDLAQGYLFSRPLTENGILDIIARREPLHA
jgi:EAL domain-containing protein (putative c-di-GMP-specific phosphodiesterase class I)